MVLYTLNIKTKVSISIISYKKKLFDLCFKNYIIGVYSECIFIVTGAYN